MENIMNENEMKKRILNIVVKSNRLIERELKNLIKSNFKFHVWASRQAENLSMAELITITHVLSDIAQRVMEAEMEVNAQLHQMLTRANFFDSIIHGFEIAIDKLEAFDDEGLTDTEDVVGDNLAKSKGIKLEFEMIHANLDAEDEEDTEDEVNIQNRYFN